ncbi:MAG: hypothetical protein ABSE51_12925 [Terracidiphilus sp.]
MNLRTIHKLIVCGFLTVAMFPTLQLKAQYLTLEGQTGGFLTPTAYVVYMEKGEKFSHPAVGFHFIDANAVIGNIETLSITEAFYGRAEAGYTRSMHQFGDSGSGTTVMANAVLGSTSSATAIPVTPSFSQLWNYNGMNVFHGKVVAINDGQFGPWTPGIAVGGLVRTNDRFVSGAAYQQAVELYDQAAAIIDQEGGTLPILPVPAAKSYTNGDVYVAVTKTWAKPPVPFLVNLGWKATNASIYGIGGQSNRFMGRLFGGLGIPLPITHGIVAVPSAGFTQQPPTVKGLGAAPPTGIPLVAGKADLPTTLDYAVRITQREKPHFAFDIGIGQVANNIGTIPSPTFLPAPAPQVAYIPVNLNARHVLGMGISYRY